MAYFRAKSLDINQLQPDDTWINNGFSRPYSDALSRDLGLKRAKFAKLAGALMYYVYDSYHTHLTISGMPAGLSIEISNLQTGDTYHGGQTSSGTVFNKPFQLWASICSTSPHAPYHSETEGRRAKPLRNCYCHRRLLSLRLCCVHRRVWCLWWQPHTTTLLPRPVCT